MEKKREDYTEDLNMYYPLIYSAVYTKIDNVEDSKDICQEIFTDFFEKYEEIKDKRKWLYGALRNEIFEFFRKKKGGEVDIDEVFDDVSLTFVNGFKEARIIIAEAIEDMELFENEEDKVLFDLIAVYNFSYSQAGRQLGLTIRQVGYKYNTMVKKLIEYLRKKGIKNIEDLL